MKTQKMSFGKIKNVLSRDEMKKIMAGSDDGCGTCTGYRGQQEACVKGAVTQVCFCSSTAGSC